MHICTLHMRNIHSLITHTKKQKSERDERDEKGKRCKEMKKEIQFSFHIFLDYYVVLSNENKICTDADTDTRG